MIQAFHYETDDKSAFLTVIDSICRVTFPVIKSEHSRLHISTSGNGFNNGRKWVGPDNMSCTDDRGWSKPKRFFICTVKDYRPDIEREKHYVIHIDDHHEIIENVEILLRDDPNFKKPLDARFREKCGQGYTDWFIPSDGDVDIGYCISYRPSGGWNNLDISLTHMYYGK